MSTERQVEDLAQRWGRARRAALLAILGEDSPEEEDALIERASARDFSELCRRVFENSLVLGQGFARYYGAQPGLEELPGVLGRLGVACLVGSWRRVEEEPALLLERDGCGANPSASRCDYWREACDGLVLGLTGGLRHTRHRSLGHADTHCLDLLYANPESPLRFGPLPPEMVPGLASIQRFIRGFGKGADVTFLGVSEGVLSYEFTAGSRCGGGEDLERLITQCVRQRFPGLTLRNGSPRAVLAPEGAQPGISE
jgi:hypothetical protein